MRALAVFGALCFLGCGVETRTTIIKTMSFPDAADEANSDDLDGDGDIRFNDNSFAGLAQNSILLDFGLDLNGFLQEAIDTGTAAIGLRVTSKNFKKDERKAALEAFLVDLGGAAPAFDGTDDISNIRPDGGPFPFEDVAIIREETKEADLAAPTQSKLSSSQTSLFKFPLVLDPLNPSFLDLQSAKIEGAIAEDGTLTGAKLTGFITARDFAAVFGSFAVLLERGVTRDATDPSFNPTGVAVPCAAVADCTNAGLQNAFCTDQDALPEATGFCVAVGSKAEGNFNGGFGGFNIDEDDDGRCEVSFNGTSFDQNELAFFFDFDANDSDGDGGATEGLFGAVLFQLDLDAGIAGRESAGVGLVFSTVSALE